MPKHRWQTLSAVFAALMTLAATAAAQITTGIIAGRVVDGALKPIEAAQIIVQNKETGLARNAVTNVNGSYAVLGLEVGTGYSVTARRIGFAPITKDNQGVSVGTTTRVDFELRTQAAQLSGVNIVAVTDPIISPSRMGVGTTITDSSLHRLPSLNRSFTDVMTSVSQISTSGPGLSGGGANNRYNNIQIDGSTEKDLFGLTSTGQPGGQANGKSIGMESVKQYQVLLSPFDVRYGNFAGALVNAVTRSGQNKLYGTTYYYLRDSALTRTQSYLAGFRQGQYGLSLGGPIVRNKAFFFINPEWQDQNNPASGPFIGGPGPTPAQADIDRVRSILSPAGYRVGTGALRTDKNPLTNVFVRFDIQNLPGNSTLTLRDNYAHAEQDNFSRFFNSTTFPLDDNGQTFKSDKSAYVAQLKSAFSSGAYNELYFGLTHIREGRSTFVPPNQPQIQVRTTGPLSIVTGAERSSGANQLDQDIYEFTENFVFPIGTSHRVTIGTQNQWFKVRNLFGQNRAGFWQFNSLDSLAGTCATCGGVATAQSFQVGVPALAGSDGSVRFHQRTNAAFIQDEWVPTNHLTVSFGLRADVSFFDERPPLNQGVLDTLKRRTDQLPSGNWQLSPRAGFNWDVTGDGVNQLRGGFGVFTGQPAFVWMANQYQNSGQGGFAQLTCNSATNKPPAFSPAAALANPPTACQSGLTAAAGAEIDLASKDLKFPQSARATLGYDRVLWGDYVLTLEGMYTLGWNQLYYQNIALAGPQGLDRHGRVMYGGAPASPVTVGGTMDPVTGLASGGYSRKQVFEITNSSNDRASQFTVALAHRYSDNFEASIAYTHSDVQDVQSLTSSTTISQYTFGRSYGPLPENDRSLGRSIFDQPHRFTFAGSYTFPTTGTDLSLIYLGESGKRFHYTYQGTSAGDLNGDGIGNDLVYVPKNVRDSNEIIFVPFGTTSITKQQDAFEKFINAHQCLQNAVGTIMDR
ncbi:MAG TPA: carboxypeptidase regulatory-like domain-containing protein, partial [Gemmatimonadaceae bacterium]|nr:carboxypeptidase regulatory-like domain-containing protein [Gemmatimonadaceae bacterium]